MNLLKFGETDDDNDNDNDNDNDDDDDGDRSCRPFSARNS